MMRPAMRFFSVPSLNPRKERQGFSDRPGGHFRMVRFATRMPGFSGSVRVPPQVGKGFLTRIRRDPFCDSGCRGHFGREKFQDALHFLPLYLWPKSRACELARVFQTRQRQPRHRAGNSDLSAGASQFIARQVLVLASPPKQADSIDFPPRYNAPMGQKAYFISHPLPGLAGHRRMLLNESPRLRSPGMLRPQ